MASQLRILTTYRCNLHNSYNTFVRNLWETLNKEFAEEFKRTYNCPTDNHVVIEEISEDEI